MSRAGLNSDVYIVSGNDYNAVPEFGERSGEIIGEGDSPSPNELAQASSLGRIARHVASMANASDSRFSLMFEILGEGIVFQNRQGEIVLCNDASATILGLTMDQLEGRSSHDPRWQALKADGSTLSGDEHPAMVALRTGQPQKDVLMRVLRPDGTRRVIKINSVPIFEDGNPEPTSAVTSFADVTSIFEEKDYIGEQLKSFIENQAEIEAKRKRLELANKKLRDEADSDPLTKLKNRRGFFERLSSEVALAGRNQLPLSLLIIDIDRLNEVQEKLGKEAGDDLLRLVTQVLKESCRLSDFVARYRSEEFAMILPCTALPQARHFADRLLESFAAIQFDMPVSACIGLAELRMGGLLNDLVEEAEEALFRAKAAGMGTCFCDPI